ncbi:MAG: right-handed parallel beta-helix repeat-containing protein, partial [Bacteroidales bacterium]|nr:right-handed parallel beta-helix repeat-containing protein [Bacteroidales bacterium]
MVLFYGYYGINVRGSIDIKGTRNNTVLLTVKDTTGFFNKETKMGAWRGLKFQSEKNDNASNITHAIIEFCKTVDFPKGGGIYINRYNNIKIENTTIRHCSANLGGGIAIESCDPKIFNCKFYNNGADYGGGALYSEESNFELVNCLLYNNYAAYGGGINFIGGNPKIINCTVARNHATLEGGGIFAQVFTNLKLYNSIVFFNSSKKSEQVRLDPLEDADIQYCDVQGDIT